MKNSNKTYSTSALTEATAKICNMKKGIATMLQVRKATKTTSHSWATINAILFNAGWAPRHLMKLLINLKQA